MIAIVPQISFIKELEDFIHFALFKHRKRRCAELIDTYDDILYELTDIFKISPVPLNGFSFHQYVFSKKEAIEIFKSAGFGIETVMPVNIEYGLINYKFIRNIYNKRHDSKAATNTVSVSSGNSLLKEIIILEGANCRAVKPLVYILRQLVANLLLIICKKI
jgi:hypothetical protein